MYSRGVKVGELLRDGLRYRYIVDYSYKNGVRILESKEEIEANSFWLTILFVVSTWVFQKGSGNLLHLVMTFFYNFFIIRANAQLCHKHRLNIMRLLKFEMYFAAK